ncbi:MAG: hypothetical protein E7Z90_03060 [Cyanobacteria bacterium SIG29]|nr:hypothetical protein [Cyanobacteria bacterium SIG29]
MFKCKKCHSDDKFELMFNPSYQGTKNFDIANTINGDIQITVDGYTFIPDLTFMNNHAVCRYCGQINCWDYD